MSGNGNTSRELLLQLNQKLTDFMVDSKADIAALSVKMDMMKESCAVMNHNSTIMAERISKLESTNKTATDYKDFAKKVGITLTGAAGFTVTILTILHLLGVAL
jgi:hypothetical protein